MKKILKNTNLYKTGRQHLYSPSIDFADLERNLINLGELPCKDIKFAYNNSQLPTDGSQGRFYAFFTAEVTPEIESVATDIAAIIGRLINFQSYVTKNWHHNLSSDLLKSLNDYLTFCNATELVKYLQVIDRFLQDNDGIMGNILSDISSRLDYSHLFGSLMSSLEALTGEYDPQASFLNQFLTCHKSVSLTHLQAMENKMIFMFYNKEQYIEEHSAHKELERKAFAIPKNHSLSALKAVTRLSLKKAANNLAVKLYEYHNEDNTSDDIGSALQVELIRLKRAQGVNDLNSIELSPTYKRKFRSLLTSNGAVFKDGSSIYPILLRPSVLFSLSNNGEIKRKRLVEIEEELIKQLDEECIEVSPLDSGKNKLLHTMFKCYSRNFKIPEVEMQKIRKAIPGIEENPTSRLLDEYKNEVSNQNVLAFFGDEIAKQVQSKKEATNPTNIEEFSELLIDKVCNGSDNTDIGRFIQRYMKHLASPTMSIRGDKSVISLLTIDIPEEFILLSYKHKARLLSCLEQNGIDVLPKNLMKIAINNGDKKLIVYLMDNYSSVLTAEEARDENPKVLLPDHCKVIKDIIVERSRAGLSFEYLLASSGLLFYTVKEDGYRGLVKLESLLGREINPEICGYIGDNGNTLSNLLIERSASNFPKFWRERLTQEARNLHAMTLNKDDCSLAALIAGKAGYFVREFMDNLSDSAQAFSLDAHGTNEREAITLAVVVTMLAPATTLTYLREKFGEEIMDAVYKASIGIIKHSAVKFREYWSKLPPLDRDKVIFHPSCTALPMYILLQTPELFEEIWTDKLSEDIKLNVLQRQIFISPYCLAMLVVDKRFDLFQEFFDNLSSEHQSLCIKQMRLNDRLPERLAVHVAKSNSGGFQKFWESLSMENKISAFDDILIENIILHCPHHFNTVWNSGFLPSEKSNLLEKMNTTLSPSDKALKIVSMAIVLSSQNPKALKSFWEFVPEDIKKDPHTFDISYFSKSLPLSLRDEPLPDNTQKVSEKLYSGLTSRYSGLTSRR